MKYSFTDWKPIITCCMLNPKLATGGNISSKYKGIVKLENKIYGGKAPIRKMMFTQMFLVSFAFLCW